MFALFIYFKKIFIFDIYLLNLFLFMSENFYFNLKSSLIKNEKLIAI